MHGQRITRSNSLNSKHNIEERNEKTTRGRKFSALSPELDISTNKRSKTTMELEKTLIAMKNELSSINSCLANLPTLEQKIDSISTDLSQFRNELNGIKEKLNSIEATQDKDSENIVSNSIQINITNQNKLDEQIMITDIPMHINKENFIANLNDWSKQLLETLGYKKLILSKSSKKHIAFIHFWSYKDKFQFMQYVKCHQKQDDKYTPILNEQVFKLNDDDVCRATALHFQTPLTKVNQGILKEARIYKKDKKIESCWMMEGSIFIKKNGRSKVERIDTIQQLRQVMLNHVVNKNASGYSVMDVTDQ